MDIERIKQLVMSREEFLELEREFDAKAPKEFDGLLTGGRTAKAVMFGIIRLAIRVDALENPTDVV